MTMNPVSKDVIDLLAANDFGAVGIDLFGMGWGEENDQQIVVIDTGGFEAEVIESLERPSFQILARGNKTAGGFEVYDNLRKVYEFLNIQGNVIINDTCYPEFDPLSPPASIGQDDEDRHLCSVNYTTFRNPA